MSERDGQPKPANGAATPPPEAPRRCSRWLVAVLVLSLAVNLLVLGAVGTMAYFHFKGTAWMTHGKWRGKADEQALRRAALGRPGLMVRALWRTMRELPEERRKALRPLLREHRQAIRQAYAEVGRLRLELATLLKTAPADETRRQAILQKLERAETETRRHIVQLIGTFLENLSPEERKLFAEKLSRYERRRHFLIWRRH